jgi:hypothetical protein
MLRLFKKWRLVRRLREECLGHIGKQGDGFVSREGTVWVSKGAFAHQTMENYRRARFWSEEHKIEKLHQIHSLLDSCIAEKFIDAFLHEDGSRRFIKTSLAGEDFCDFTDFLEFCLSKYRSVATNIIIPIVTFALGFLGPSIIKKLTEKPPQKTYQAPTPAEAAQVTPPLTTQDPPSQGQNTGTSGASSKSGKVPHKEPKPAAPSASPPAISQDCGGGNCAVSLGQRGGITAGRIDIETPPVRQLTDAQKEGIKDFLKTIPQTVLVTVGSVYGSGDGDIYANQFLPLFDGRHYENQTAAAIRTGFPATFTGVFVATATEDDPATPYRDAFQKELVRLGINSRASNGSKVTPGNLELLVGYRPEEVKQP